MVCSINNITSISKLHSCVRPEAILGLSTASHTRHVFTGMFTEARTHQQGCAVKNVNNQAGPSQWLRREFVFYSFPLYSAQTQQRHTVKGKSALHKMMKIYRRVVRESASRNYYIADASSQIRHFDDLPEIVSRKSLGEHEESWLEYFVEQSYSSWWFCIRECWVSSGFSLIFLPIHIYNNSWWENVRSCHTNTLRRELSTKQRITKAKQEGVKNEFEWKMQLKDDNGKPLLFCGWVIGINCINFDIYWNGLQKELWVIL